MRVDIKGVHYQITDVTREFLNSKLEKVAYADDYIVDLLFTLTKDNSDWVAEVNANFRWGVSAHLKEATFNLHESIEKLIDRLDQKIRKEKDKKRDSHR
jgi:putative sigma-54 modulation protein